MPSFHHQRSVLIPECQAKAFKATSLVKATQYADALQTKIIRDLHLIKEAIDGYLSHLLPESITDSIEVSSCDIQCVNDWSNKNEASLFSVPFGDDFIYSWIKKSEVFALSSVSLGGPMEMPANPSNIGRIEKKLVSGLLNTVVESIHALLIRGCESQDRLLKNNVLKDGVLNDNLLTNNSLDVLPDRVFFSEVIPLQVTLKLNKFLFDFFVLLPKNLASFYDDSTIESSDLYRMDFEQKITLSANVTMAKFEGTYQQLQRWMQGEVLSFDFLEKMPLSIEDNICGNGYVTEDKGQLVFKFER